MVLEPVNTPECDESNQKYSKSKFKTIQITDDEWSLYRALIIGKAIIDNNTADYSFIKDEKIIELVPQIQEYLKNNTDQSFKDHIIRRALNAYNVSPDDIYEKYVGLLEPRNANDYNSGPFLRGDVSISGIAFSKLNNDIRIISFRDGGNCYVMNYDTNPAMNIDYSKTIFLLQDNGNHFDLLLPTSSPFITYDQLIDAVKNEPAMNQEVDITDTNGNITKTTTLEIAKNFPPPPTDQLLIASIVNNTIGINKLPKYTRTIARQLNDFALQNNDDYETFVATLKNALEAEPSNVFRRGQPKTPNQKVKGLLGRITNSNKDKLIQEIVNIDDVSTPEEYKDVIKELYDYIKLGNVPQFPSLIELILKMNEKHLSSPYPGELPSKELFNLLRDRLDEEPIYVKMIEEKKNNDPAYKVDYSEDKTITDEKNKYQCVCFFLGYMYTNNLINLATLSTKIDQLQENFEDNSSNDIGNGSMEGILDILIVAGKSMKQNNQAKYNEYYNFINDSCASGTRVQNNKTKVLCKEFLLIANNDFNIYGENATKGKNIRWGLLAPAGTAVKSSRYAGKLKDIPDESPPVNTTSGEAKTKKNKAASNRAGSPTNKPGSILNTFRAIIKNK